MHAYLQRTEPARLVPSTPSYTVAAPAIADTAIAVGNWSIDAGQVHFSSSLGPRLDGLLKPDVLAPGTDVVSCADSSNQADGSTYTAKTGTSMSSPAVCGAIALLLEASPDLPPQQVKTILRLSADRVASADNEHGFGVIDCVHALQLAERGVPTECDPTEGSFLDRDEDRVPDHCQIAENPELDTNRNGLFDEYETFFHRGDSNTDDNLDISDAASVIGHLFLGGTEPVCTEAADTNDDGRLDVSDAIAILVHLFLGVGLEIPYPGPPGHPCGANTTSPSFLGCDFYPGC